MPAGPSPVRYRATFNPQAWVNDYAIAVDPEGETSWDCTAFVAELEREVPGWLARTMENGADPDHGSDHDDFLRTDPAAPEWIREWHGPFDTYLEVVDG